MLTDKDGSVFFIDEGRGQTQNGALRRARNGEVETLVQCSSGPFQSPTCLAFSPAQDTLYISQYSYTDESNTKTDFNIIYVTREGGFVDVRGLCRAKKVGTTGLAVHPKQGKCSSVIKVLAMCIVLTDRVTKTLPLSSELTMQRKLKPV